ncbi:MAG: GTPase domain-containing protein [Phycisphaeraceae bacterium]
MISFAFDMGEARAWLDSVPGAPLGGVFERQWETLQEIEVPVITLYGAYDTGKSSLLRRLIVDSGGDVPEWLTISARHETFEVSQIEVASCMVRDTPGFVPGGADVRAGANSELAADAVRLTDIGMVVLTPQLATAEFLALKELVDSGWVPGSLWFVISRFDEAGIDPESDITGYRALGQRKIAELRSALNLDESVAIFVVCQDFAQMAGAERSLDASFWSDSREWDGMDHLETAVADVGRSGLAPLRDAAAMRFWSQAVASTMAQLSREVEDYRALLTVCDVGLSRRESWFAQLADVQESAEADLRGKIGEAVSEAVHDPTAAGMMAGTIKTTLDLWFRDQERQVHKLLQAIQVAISTERKRPSWEHLGNFANSARSRQSEKVRPRLDDQIFAPAAKKVTSAVLDAFLAYRKLGRPKAASSGTSRDALDKRVAGAAVVVVDEAVRLLEIFYGRNAVAAERARERERLEAELTRVGQRAATVALEAIKPLFDDAREAINSETAEEVEMRQGVMGTLAELDACVTAGRALLYGDGA